MPDRQLTGTFIKQEATVPFDPSELNTELRSDGCIKFTLKDRIGNELLLRILPVGSLPVAGPLNDQFLTHFVSDGTQTTMFGGRRKFGASVIARGKRRHIIVNTLFCRMTSPSLRPLGLVGHRRE
jgi:hypothetical protein